MRSQDGGSFTRLALPSCEADNGAGPPGQPSASPVNPGRLTAVDGGGAQRDRTSLDVHRAPPSGQFDQWVFGGCVAV